VIDDIRRSVVALRGLPPSIQLAARHIYYDAIRIALLASALCALCSFLASFFANGEGLTRESESKVEETSSTCATQADSFSGNV
jgi:hypothetical protein